MLDTHWLMWKLFFMFLLVAFTLDMLLTKYSKIKNMSAIKSEGIITASWIMLALIFMLALWAYWYSISELGVANQKTFEFFTAYMVEKTLSIDHLFIFYSLFSCFIISLKSQKRLLFYGITIGIILRLWLVLNPEKIFSYNILNPKFFSSFLFFLALYLLFFYSIKKKKTPNIQKKNLIFRKPLLTILCFGIIVLTDIIFALESVPAVYSITQDPFIVFTANVFALLGLHALYFLIAHVAQKNDFFIYGNIIVLIIIAITPYW